MAYVIYLITEYISLSLSSHLMGTKHYLLTEGNLDCRTYLYSSQMIPPEYAHLANIVAY